MARFLGVLLLVGLIIRFWVWVVVAVLVWLLVRGVVSWRRRVGVARGEWAVWEAGLRERADRQHAQTLAGDAAGWYGEYPPAC